MAITCGAGSGRDAGNPERAVRCEAAQGSASTARNSKQREMTMLSYKVLCGDCKMEYEQERSKPTICGACGSDFIAVKLIEQPDVKVTNHGSVMMVEPVSKEAVAWVNENVGLEGWQWMGNAFAVEPRLLSNLLDGMREEGFTVGSW